MNKLLKVVLYFFFVFGVASIIFIVKKQGTTGCDLFHIIYCFSIVSFVISTIIAKLLYNRTRSFSFILLVPCIFIIMFLSLYLSYKYNRINIYEQIVGGEKTWDTYTDLEHCNYVLLKLLSK